jgi:hypothetical protein
MEHFQTYLDHVNKIILKNVQFLKAQLNIDSLTIEIVKPRTNFLSKLWTNQLMDSTVIVQYTLIPINTTQRTTALLTDDNDLKND